MLSDALFNVHRQQGIPHSVCMCVCVWGGYNKYCLEIFIFLKMFFHITIDEAPQITIIKKKIFIKFYKG